MYELKDGWHDRENDGLRDFTWSSDSSLVELFGSGNTLRIFAGTDRPKRVLKFKYDDGTEYSFKTFNGWKYYFVPYSGQKFLTIETEAFNPPDDTRTLGVMVSDIVTLQEEHSNDCCWISDESLVESYTGNTFFVSDLKSKYIDIVYTLYEPDTTKIKITDTDSGKEEEFDIISGGSRIICYETESKNSLNFEVSIEDNVNMVIKSVVNRNDYSDYLGLTEYVEDKPHWKYEEHKDKHELSIQWFMTWKCNYKCGYCWQEVSKELYRYDKWDRMAPELWANAFNKLNPYSIYLTGGEPSLYKKLPEFISLLDKKTIVSITTNFGRTFDLDKWKSIIKPGRVTGFWASFHPTQLNNVDEFFSKADQYLDLYGSHGFGLEMVLHKDNLPYKEKFLDFCKTRDIQYSLDPFVAQYEEDNQPEVNPKEFVEFDSNNRAEDKYNKLPIVQTAGLKRERICNINAQKQIEYTEKLMAPKNLRLKLDEKTDEPGRLPIFCTAGMSRINVDMEGDAFTCMSAIDRGKLFKPHSLPHYKPIGNVLDDNFELLKKPIVCWESFRCSACDFELVDYYWEPINSNFKYKLPLPE
tara:strand:- start:93632 stop:95377 length:1746 start_codon:yes stop_codon:yes gene_type:complete